MSSSNALIPWDPDTNTAVATLPENSRPEGGRWALVLNALLSPSPGRTLDRVYTSIGKGLETQANRTAHTFGLGPGIVSGKIKSYFGNDGERVKQLELLRITIPPKLEKKCLKLMKYTLPAEAANTQCQAFKEIVDLVTIFPGLRVLFLQIKPLASATSLDPISALWDRSTGAPDKEWTFWKTLAATCMTDATVSTILEASSVAEFGKCHEEGLDIIEQLLIEHDCCGSSEYSNALCVRYLAGVLSLPGFWLEISTIHGHVANKLCSKTGQILKDIGVDIPLLGPVDESENPFDYDGVDILAATLLRGISSWFAKIEQEDWSVQQRYESCAKILKLLRAPRAAELLPQSHNSASNAFENILPTTFHDSELHVMVDGENTTSKEKPSHEDKNLTDFKSENMSTPSLHSGTSNQDHTPSVEYMDEIESQHSDRDSAEPSTEDDESILMSDLSDVESIQMDFACNISAEREDPSRPDFGYGQDVVGDWNHDTMDVQQISAEQGSLNVTSYPSLADQWQKDAKEWRAILQQRQRDLGENHLETLDAMESLAGVQHELGEYKSASDLHAVVLEKRTILLGKDDPQTLHAMHILGNSYGALGQSKAAESLLLSALDRRKEVLGKNHPQTLQTTMDLATVYRNLGQWTHAEGLQILALEKQWDLFGENNVDTVTAMRDLAITCHHQGQYEKTQELYASALKKYREILGKDPPDTLETMSRLAMTYGQLGWQKESEQLHQIVLQKRRILLGEDHPDTLTAMAELASAYTSLGQLENAESLLVVVLKKHKDLLGEDHPRTLRTMGHLVKTFHQLGQFSTAEELALVALEKEQQVLGEDHPDTLWTMGELAWTYQMQGRFDHAEELYAVLFEKWRKFLGDDHPATKWTTESLAWTYHALGKIQAAEEVEKLLEVMSTGQEA